MSESAVEAEVQTVEQALVEAVAAGTVPDASESLTPRTDSKQPETGVPAEQLKALFGETDPAKIKQRLDHAREWEKRAKQNADAARKYAEWEDSQKSEQQRLADQLAAAEQRALQAEVGRAKLMAAATYNIPVSMLDRIGGSTEDEISEAAEAIASEIAAAVEAEVAKRLASASAPQAEPVQPARTRPVESLTPGGLASDGEGVDGNAFLRLMAGRKP